MSLYCCRCSWILRWVLFSFIAHPLLGLISLYIAYLRLCAEPTSCFTRCGITSFMSTGIIFQRPGGNAFLPAQTRVTCKSDDAVGWRVQMVNSMELVRMPDQTVWIVGFEGRAHWMAATRSASWERHAVPLLGSHVQVFLCKHRNWLHCHHAVAI